MRMNHTDEWKEEFDKKFGEINQHYEEFFYTSKIKSYISNLLSSQRARDRAVLREKVEKMLPDPMTESERDEFHCEGAILQWGEEVLEILKD